MTTLKLRIDWAELDLFGHVNNVMFLKYAQAARLHYWEQIGLYESFKETGIGSMVASVSCHFRKPLYYPGDVVIQSTMLYIKNTSFSLQHLILDDNGEIAAEATDIQVMYDFNKNEKLAVPQAIRDAVIRLEGKGY